MKDSCLALEKQLEKRHTYVTQSDLQSLNAASEAGEIIIRIVAEILTNLPQLKRRMVGTRLESRATCSKEVRMPSERGTGGGSTCPTTNSATREGTERM